MADPAISSVNHSSTPKVNKDLENAKTVGAYMASTVSQQHAIFGDTEVQLTDKQRRGSIFLS